MFSENEAIISKADVLQYLSGRVKRSRIEKIMILHTGEFEENPDRAAEKAALFFQGKIVVRSSSLQEDSMESSNAGHFDSVLDVDSRDREAVKAAVRHVMSTYMDQGVRYPGFEKEEVLLQQQTENVSMAGVIFTRDIRKNRPYFTVNYADDGSTDAVTSGRGGSTVYIPLDLESGRMDPPFDKLADAVREILDLCSIDNLDIEFGISGEDVVIFQCRPLAAVTGKPRTAPDEEVFRARKKAHADYSTKGHILSDMAFWNPSEIIGDNPFPLDYSLYREIITNNIWSAGIAPMGYHYVNDDLMIKIGNKPYISVDDAFEGLIPEMLPARLQRKLKNYYVKRLIDDPSSHDKIEFEIVFSVYDFCTDQNLDSLLDHGFTKNEIAMIRRSLFYITDLAVKSYGDIYQDDCGALQRMRELRHKIRHENILASEDPEAILKAVEELLSSIKTDGTPQFSRMARLAFIARSFCRTLVSQGYVSGAEMDLFNRSINTVASDFERDFDALCQRKMSRGDFNAKYGHLRLGTYNIRTDCYSEMYFAPEDRAAGIHEKQKITSASLNEENVQRALDDHEMDFSAATLIDFIRKTTENREYFKFEFTKSLSLALNLLIRFGVVCSIPRDDLSFLEIRDFFAIREVEKIREKIEENRRIFRINSGLILPEVIFGGRDMDMVYAAKARPNFITAREVTAPVALLDGVSRDEDLAGKIVVITKADPGYDWIFTKGIAGFISRYGGAASHMAIRCAEFDIPAAIGCGEKLFHDVCTMKVVHLDCRNRKIEKAVL